MFRSPVASPPEHASGAAGRVVAVPAPEITRDPRVIHVPRVTRDRAHSGGLARYDARTVDAGAQRLALSAWGLRPRPGPDWGSAARGVLARSVREPGAIGVTLDR
ncbi:hypothetical protein GCM10012275_48290 [Longimycelium tulufanense]|uniref:Uncharacterized protein n=1 Tax=Longimycelium tulufanense TaxID=907463 RepID=A0A8J3FVW5_9PSEU|nr:hypothetical protein GCM10012275_48290 [Longimycelium tulufanense]